jgi:hypothetical protein
MKGNVSIWTILILGILGFTLQSCGPNEEERKKSAEALVRAFVDELNMENFRSAKDIYPGLDSINRYNVLSNFQITSSSIKSNDPSSVTVMGDYGMGEFRKPIQFTVGMNGERKPFISKSKGLSHFYESPLYNALKRSGCLSNIESDAVIHQECLRKGDKFESLVNQWKEQIERGIVFEKTGSQLTNNYNIHITGELMLRNTTNVNVPRYSYDIYIVLYDRNGQLVHSSKYDFNNDPIMANQLHQISIYSLDYSRSFKSYSALVRIKDDSFLREYLSQSGNFNCSDFL